MNILILCNKSPFPAKEGGPMAIGMIAEGLIRAGHRVKILGMNTNKYHVDPGSIPEDYKVKTGIELISVDLRFKPLKAFFNLFTGRSYHVERFISEAFRAKLEDILRKERFDVVQFEMPFMSPYLDTVRRFSGAKTVLRAHNIEHLIWDRLAGQTRNPLKRIYLKHLAKTLKNHELTVVNDFDGVAAITKTDADFFFVSGCKVPITDIPFGIDLSNYPFVPRKAGDFSLFSIGSMNWIPNQEGILWFLENVWRHVTRQHPTLKYYIAGREMPLWLKERKDPNVEVVGEVEDAIRFIGDHTLMIVPLFSGSGIRIKIIEGMACGKAIISTTIGAEGIHCTHGENILLADTSASFCEWISKCVSDPTFTEKIGENARKLISKEYDRDRIIQKLAGFYQKIGS